jgi:hypothetical protein
VINLALPGITKVIGDTEQLCPIWLKPQTVRSQVNGRHDNPAELTSANNHQTFADNRIGSEWQMFAVLF